MRITCGSKLLADELRLLNRIVNEKATLPILGSVLMKAEGDGITMIATDLEVALQTKLPAFVEEDGVTTLPAKKIQELTERISETDVTFTTEGTQVIVESGKFASKFQTISAADFPVIAQPEGRISPLNVRNLRRLIECTEYAISDKVQKYHVSGALLKLEGPLMVAIATDGKRLSVITSTRSDTGEVEQESLIPQKTLNVLVPFCDSDDGEGLLDFSRTEQHLFFVRGHRMLLSRMLSGKFPDYTRIVPNCDKTISVNRMMLTDALRRVGVISDENLMILLTVGGNQVLLKSSSASGEAEERVSTTYDGELTTLSANGKHLLDFLDRARQPNITISFIDAMHPMLLQDSDTFVNVVMGIRIGD